MVNITVTREPISNPYLDRKITIARTATVYVCLAPTSPPILNSLVDPVRICCMLAGRASFSLSDPVFLRMGVGLYTRQSNYNYHVDPVKGWCLTNQTGAPRSVHRDVDWDGHPYPRPSNKFHLAQLILSVMHVYAQYLTTPTIIGGSGQILSKRASSFFGQRFAR